MTEKRKPYRNKKILQAAEGEGCTLNTPWCNYDRETTVLCHLNYSFAGKGGSQKADDFAAAFGCNGPRSCHAYMDGNEGTEADRYFYWLRGMCKTIRRLLDKGVLK